MLVGMDMSPAGPWIPPWLALAIGLAVALAGVWILLALRRRQARRSSAAADRAAPAGSAGAYRDDDLPGFLASPPGSAGSPVAAPDGWPALGGTAAAPSPAPDPAEEPSAVPRRKTVVLGALTLLLAAAVVLVVVDRSGQPGRTGGSLPRETVDLPPVPAAPEPGQPGAGDLADASVGPGRDGGAARLEFGGLVLEQRAVGITATYPAVEVTWNRESAVAHLRLPTFNCLTDSAPEDPVAAGCLATMTEHADLPSPALTVTGEDGRVALSGRFPTYLRPNGSPPVWTGRVYEFRVDAAPVGGEPAAGWVRAEGEIRLGSGRAAALDRPDVTVLRLD
jgi:hypothetical protein